MSGWTHGAELELADIDRKGRFPSWTTFDLKDVSMVNSTGVAVDPKAQLHDRGGEVLTAPSQAADGVASQLLELLQCQPDMVVNYRSNLHVHVRIPGLREDLEKLKHLQTYIHRWMPKLLPIIEPIPKPTEGEYPEEWAYRGARSRYNRRKVSHQKLLSERVVARQLKADTPQRFFEAEALHEPSGRLLWATCPRACINLRQLLQTDTVEFRHFPGTIDPYLLGVAVKWCDLFLQCAFESSEDVEQLAHSWWDNIGPIPFKPYDHRLEEGYLLTSTKHQTRDAVLANIPRVLAGDY